MTLESYLLAFMLAMVPPSEHWKEAPEVAEWRYARIAETLANVARASCTDTDCEVKTGLLLASVASYESAFRADVDRCEVMGDHGTSFGLFQLAGRRDLCGDRRGAALEALRLLRGSVSRCGNLQEYVSGSCERGRVQAKLRWERARQWYRAHPYDLGTVSS